MLAVAKFLLNNLLEERKDSHVPDQQHHKKRPLQKNAIELTLTQEEKS